MGETLLDLWDRSKPYVVLFSASIPLLGVLISALSGDSAWLFKFSLTLIAYQLGFLIAICFETQRIIKRKDAPENRTSQISDNPFWRSAKNRKVRELRLFALNGGRFAKELDKYDMRVTNIRAIFPSKRAIEHCFYEPLDGSSHNRISRIDAGISEFVQILETRKLKGKLGTFEIRRANFFTYSFYALFTGGEAIVGAYFPDVTRNASTGLKGVSWLETDKEKNRAISDQFENIWGKLQ